MIEAPEPPTCMSCKQIISFAQSNQSVFIKVWSGQHRKYIETGPYHGKCGKLLSNKKSKVEGRFN